MKEAERKEQQRLDEIAARDRKMKNILDTMGDLVKDNEKEKNKAAEKLYIENCINSDKLAQQQEQAKKLQRKRDALKMNNFLGS